MGDSGADTTLQPEPPQVSRRTDGTHGCRRTGRLRWQRRRPWRRQEGPHLPNWEQVKGNPLEQAIQAFEKESGTKVTVQPAVTQEYDTKMRTLIAGGSPPDVMRINDDFVRGFSQQGALLDLKPYIEKDKLDTSQFAKETYRVPQAAGRFAHRLGARLPTPADLLQRRSVQEGRRTAAADDLVVDRVDLGRFHREGEEAHRSGQQAVRRSGLPGHRLRADVHGQPRQSDRDLLQPTAPSSRCPARRRPRHCSGRPT